jgi:hypothetical protein
MFEVLESYTIISILEKKKEKYGLSYWKKFSDNKYINIYKNNKLLAITQCLDSTIQKLYLSNIQNDTNRFF